MLLQTVTLHHQNIMKNDSLISILSILKFWFKRVLLSALCLLITGNFCFLYAQDVSGSSDHPLISRYEGSEIVKYETKEFTDYSLLTGPAKNYGGIEQNRDATIILEGKVTRITYRAPAERSPLEVFRNYEAALAEAGFEQIFNCAREECGGRNFNHAASPKNYYMGFGEYHAEQRYLAASLNRPGSEVYVSLYLVLNKSGGGPDRNRALVQLDVIELTAMDEQMVLVDANAMLRDLAAEGRVSLYGILFNYDEDTLLPESGPQLEEIGELLSQNPELRVFVVGHTDGQGSYEYNVDLSQRRAGRVVESLVNDHGIDRNRLQPVGVGMVAPVATNRTEEGRTLNRRVEIVEW